MLLVVGGAVWLASSSEVVAGLGQALIGAAGIIVVANLFIRLSIASNSDRDLDARRSAPSKGRQEMPPLARWALPVALIAIGAAIWAAASTTPLTAVGIALVVMGVPMLYAFNRPGR